MARPVGSTPEALERRKARDRLKSRAKRDKRRADKIADAKAKAVTAPPKPNRHTLVFRREVPMTKAEMYEMLATAAANTARM